MASILGTRWRFRAVGGGTFHCPRCDRERDYTSTHARPFLAIFDQSLLPIAGDRTLIACDACGAVYDASVTMLDPSAAREVRSEDELALEAILAATVFSDSTIREVEKEATHRAVRTYARRPVTPESTPERLDTLRRRGGLPPFERLERISGALTDGTKRRILAAAYSVSAADREMHSQEARLLMRLGEALDLHPRQVRQAMKDGVG